MTAETAVPPTAAYAADAVLTEVVGLLVEVVGDEILIATEIDRDSSFNEDLAVESIEFVALAEKLEARYGARVDFMAFLSEMEMDEILTMTVGTLVDYIAAQPAGEPGGEV
ncbi:phosphopantetheine-binding protein [Yinghuangia soli]|uniref:Phosphopantetheine-binding protein n=1 Tax=Yinghuangia soli TaxID=2908204 RepID=A0AA41U2Q9_9ACTN|nr:phosphopantetheine-binding protein [Yinghuangia soli]MCF2530955.1 phosphopantetheine-binding protein [Yinghuangia soli]